MAYASPVAALDAVKAALDSVSNRIHTGSRDSGLTLDCCCDDCDGPLLRIETGITRAKEGTVSMYALKRKRCQELVLDMSITYLTCFNSFEDNEGPGPVDLTEASEQGRAYVTSWWDALSLLKEASPLNQSVRFQNESDLPPSGGCAGWQMDIEVDLSVCE